MNDRSERWAGWIARWYRWILIISLIISVGAAWSLTRLRLDIDVLSMLPAGSPGFDNFKTLIADFGQLDELVVLIDGDRPEQAQEFADLFTARVAALGSVSSVQGKLDPTRLFDELFGRHSLNYLSTEQIRQLNEQLSTDHIEETMRGNRAALQAPLDLQAGQWIRRDPLGIARLAAQGLSDTFGERKLGPTNGYLSSTDGRAVLVLIRPTGSPFDAPFTTEFIAAVRAAEDATHRATNDWSAVRVRYTGSYAFAHEDAATIQADITRYTVLALLGVLAIFYAGYRNLRIIPFVTYPTLLGTLITFVLSLAIYDQLNAVSMTFAAILYGVSIDSGIQYYTRLVQELRSKDLPRAVAATVRGLGAANIIASTTTAAGFAVIGMSRIVGISQLGYLTALGMLIDIAEFFLIYPALSFIMSPRALADRQIETPRLGAITAASVRLAWPITLATAAITVVLALVASGTDFDVDLTSLRPGGTQAAAVQEEIATRFIGKADSGAILVRGGSVDAALEASEKLNTILEKYRRDGLLSEVHSITPLLPSAHTQRERLAAATALPRERIVADLRAASEHQGFRREAFEGFAEQFLHPDTSIVSYDDPALGALAGLVQHHVRVHDSTVRIATYIEPVAGTRLSAIAERLGHDAAGIDMIVAGRGMMEEDLSHLLKRELTLFCLAAFLLNLVLIVWRFPSLRDAAALLYPELLVILAFLAILHLSGLRLDPVSVIVVPIILGIGVNNCVYIAERARRGMVLGEAVRLGGRALVLCSLTATAGFGFLGMSDYPALSRMGLLAAASLLLCLITSLTVLPALWSVGRADASSPGAGRRG